MPPAPDTTAAFVARLRALGVEVWAEDGRLRLSAPKGVVTPELRGELEQRKAELLAFLPRVGAVPGASGRIEPAPRDGALPLSFAQERFWFLDQLEQGGATNLTLSLRLRGALDEAALAAAFTAVAERHEILRTTYPQVDGKPVQRIAPPSAVPLPVTDLTGEGDPLAAARAVVSQEAARAFDLAHGPVVRPRLLRLGANDHVLVVAMPHIATDGWSFGVLSQELSELYAAQRESRAPQLPALSAQYVDYAAWQRQWYEGAKEELLGYWRERLAGLPTLELPTDRPRPAVQRFHGKKRRVALPPELVQRLDVLGRSAGCTWFMTMLAAFDVLLARTSGQDDVVVGTPIANRGRTELEPLIGLFLNTLVVRTDLSGTPTFRELLRRVREVAISAFAHQEMPFEQLVLALKPERDLSRNPLFQVLFNVLHQAPPPQLGDVEVSELAPNSVTSAFDLTLALARDGDRVTVILEYDTDLFEEATIARMEQHFSVLLHGIADDPDRTVWELPLLTEDEKRALLVDVNATARDVPSIRFVDRFGEQAAARPDAVAAVCGEATLTYAELEAQSNQLSHHLIARGAGRDRMVGVAVERGLPMLVALLAIQKAGAAYVPLDPAYPNDRLAFVIEDAGIELLVTQQSLRDELPERLPDSVRLDVDAEAIARQPTTPPAPQSGAGDLAYVIYTSGSTGKPKGVQIEHRSLSHFLAAMVERPGITADDVVLAQTTISFDISCLELYLPLWVGARVVIARRGEESDGEKIATLLERNGVTVMQATPASWHLLLESGWPGRPSLRILCGGEALTRELADRLLPECKELWNVYGPTETTVWALVHRVTPGQGPIPIGTPIANTQVWLLDRHGQPVPTGVSGRLFLGGRGVARGYRNRPDLTAERFLPHPFSSEPDARVYDTGDLARFLPDGTLVFQGRVDHQVKVRGFRIELGEIEHTLVSHDAVKECVVVPQGESPGDVQLAAYVVAMPGSAPTAAELKSHLRRELPEYMVPSAFEVMDALPLTPNGKVDRKTLSARRVTSRSTEGGHAPPRDVHEEKVAAVWREVLQVERVGRTDNFFDLGGHSLLIVQLRRRLQQACGVELSIAEVFQFPTVAAMAAHVGHGGETPALAGASERGGKQRAAMDRFKRQAKGRRTTG